jgi:hypothetical protein
MIRFRTETGSLYEIDTDKKTWARLEEPKTEGSYPLRTTSGTYLQHQRDRSRLSGAVAERAYRSYEGRQVG